MVGMEGGGDPEGRRIGLGVVKTGDEIRPVLRSKVNPCMMRRLETSLLGRTWKGTITFVFSFFLKTDVTLSSFC
jgi:hypothetical protein